MPLYDYACPDCGSRTEVFARTVASPLTAPACTRSGCNGEMRRVPSPFARHLTTQDKIVEAEAKFGKEVDDAMGPEMDIGHHVRRYDALARDLPPPDVP